MSYPFTWARACALSLAVLVAAPAPMLVHAADKSETAKPSKKTRAKTAKVAKAKTAKVKFLPSSAESTAERRIRLKNECKGRVNAGACEGYTQ